jgi:cytochrome c-type biogenesis protein
VIEHLFINLGHAVVGAPLIALAAAFIWGILSIVLSPCHLASLPLIVGFISGQRSLTARRAFLISFLFAVGILLTIAAIGGLTAAAGRMLGDVGRWGNYIVAIIFFAVGLHLLEVISLSLPGAAQPGLKSRGLFAAFILGLIFGIALGPCTFAYMAPMLAVTFKLSSSAWLYGAALLLSYGAGHCAVIVLAGSSAGTVQRYLNWNEHSRTLRLIKKACGLLILLAGIYLLYTVR